MHTDAGAGAPAFDASEIERYSRHILLDGVGGQGQARLRAGRVLIVGAGGLGSPLLLYLAAAGIGRIGIADHDALELSNLQRQIAHRTDRLGWNKALSAAETARSINPLPEIVAHPVRVTGENVDALVGAYEVIADGSDNFETRFTVADACVRQRKTLVSAAVLQFEGQLATFRPDGPCYRCLHPAAPPPELTPTCAEAGVLGAVTGVMGTLQATEVLKEVLGIGETLAGRLLIWDALAAAFRVIRLTRDPACPACGANRAPPARF